MKWRLAFGAAVITALLAAAIARSAFQRPAIQKLDRQALREYAGVYRFAADELLYLHPWDEFGGQLVALDESGEIRTLYPSDRDRFFAGPGVGVSSSIESRIEFQRDAGNRITSLTWQREGKGTRTAPRIEAERHDDVQFANGDIRLAGTLIRPMAEGPLPAVILVHGSGAATRDQVLPFARFLVRHGMAVLGYDKRGVGGSTGDWNTASFDDLAGDVTAAFEYLNTRGDIDRGQIGLLGWSQAGWIMPLAVLRARDIAFVISVSGAAVPAAETTLDQARNEMAGRGMKPQTIEQIISLMNLQYEYASTGQGWEKYATARLALAARLGAPPPETFPETPDHPWFQFIKRLYFYDPAPAIRQLRAPLLAIFGALDNNIVAEKNRAAWEAALKEAGHSDFTLRVLSRANHAQMEAKLGTNAEIPSLQRFVPEYRTTIIEWLMKRVPRLAQSKP